MTEDPRWIDVASACWPASDAAAWVTEGADLAGRFLPTVTLATSGGGSPFVALRVAMPFLRRKWDGRSAASGLACLVPAVAGSSMSHWRAMVCSC